MTDASMDSELMTMTVGVHDRIAMFVIAKIACVRVNELNSSLCIGLGRSHISQPLRTHNHTHRVL
jgi:hypothetical protein